MKRLGLVILMLVALGLPLSAMAQPATGRITGAVSDSTGGVLPGVTVTLKGPTGVVSSTVTDSSGRYLFDKLAPGTYEVSFELPGFATQTSTVPVAAGQPATVDIKLQVGGRTEAVQVTGTLIPRPTLEAMSPVTTLEVEELTYRGINRVEDLLTSLPQVFVAQNSSVSNGASGTATVDLRYLGPNRTLVLIDGRRMPNGDARIFGADLNFIPSALVKRVDVLTGGASATYGADAVAGVVNFVLDRDFTGFRGGVEYSGYQHNNRNSVIQALNEAKGFNVVKGSRWNDGPINFNIAFGSKFADGKGHASFYLDYRKTGAITKDQRDYTNCSVIDNPLAETPYCGGSGTWPAGRFIANDNTSYVLDTSNPLGNQLRLRTPDDVYNYAPKNFMQRPDLRWAGGAFLNYDLNKYMQIYGDVMFMDDTTDAQIAESGDFGNTFTIDCRNPLMSAQEVQLLCIDQGYNGGPLATTNYIANVQIYKRNVEGGGRVNHINHTDLRYTGGLKGTLNTVWSYDVYGLQATVRSPQSYNNDLNVLRLQNALLVGPDGRCTNDTVNCVPWNIWNVGGVTQAQLAYLNLDEVLDTGTRTRVFNATLKGDLKDYGIVSPMATESLKVALGFEYREENLFVRSDYPFEAELGAGSGGPTLSVDGTYSAKEFFVEALVPLVQDKPGAKDLSIEAGFRESKYSSTGAHATYKLQMSWAPTPDFKFRVGYNRATRSPNIQELYVPQGIGLGGSSDPCAGAAPTYTAAQCELTGVPTSQYGLVLENPAGQYNTLGGGNPNLSPEVANTWTAGAVITPRKFLPGFTFTVDFYNVKLNDTIGALASNDILNTCATTGALCNLIHRDQFYTTWRSSQGYVITANSNVGGRHVEGIDLTGSYTRPAPRDLGAFSINFIGSYVLKQVTNTGLYQYDCVGLFGNTCSITAPNPRWRHLTRFSWETPWNFTFTAGWRFLGPVMEESGSSYGALTNPERFALLESNGNMAARIPTFNWVDMAVTWKIRKGITFIAGVNNVFDKEPPLGIGSQPNDYGAGFYGTYDALGRYIHTGFQFTF